MLSATPVRPAYAFAEPDEPDAADPASQFALTTEYAGPNETPRAVLQLRQGLRPDELEVSLQQIEIELRFGTSVLETQTILIDIAEQEFVDDFVDDRVAFASELVLAAIDEPLMTESLVPLEVLLDVDAFLEGRDAATIGAAEAADYYESFRIALADASGRRDNPTSADAYESGLRAAEALSSAGALLTGRLRVDAGSSDSRLASAASAAGEALGELGGSFYTIFSGLGGTHEIAREERRVQGYDGETRARIYLLSYMTGLRKGEIASLTPSSFDLDGEQPTVTVSATASKRRRKDTLPLHHELVDALRVWLTGLEALEPLFPLLAKRKAYTMIRRDLEAAGIAYRTEEGVADFHAAGRHTHITGLLKSGVPIATARELARHSDVRMTMKYTHIGLSDQARAVNHLPAPPAQPDTPADACLHSVCSNGGALGQSEDPSGTAGQQADLGGESRNPLSDRGFGNNRQAPARDGRGRQKVEAAGIEPSDDFDVTCDGVCDCENCQQCRAAYALHLECFKRHWLASLDADLQRVFSSWDSLAGSVRSAIGALVRD